MWTRGLVRGTYARGAHGRRSRLHRHRDRHRVRPGDGCALVPVAGAAPGRVDGRAGAVRPRLGRARDRRLDRLGPRHVPRVLPARRGAQRAVARARHRLPPDGPQGSATGCASVLLVFTGIGDRRRARRADARRDRGRPGSPSARTTSACSRACSPASASGLGAVVVFGGAGVVGGPLRAVAPPGIRAISRAATR